MTLGGGVNVWRMWKKGKKLTVFTKSESHQPT